MRLYTGRWGGEEHWIRVGEKEVKSEKEKEMTAGEKDETREGKDGLAGRE